MRVLRSCALPLAVSLAFGAASFPSPPVRAQGWALSTQSDTIAIDFRTCRPHGGTIWTSEGSTTYRVLGLQGTACHMLYGGEVENPRWDGRLPISCLVPRRLGIITFGITPYRVDFSPIGRYCRGQLA